METSTAVKLFASLAQETRLSVLRLLVEAGPAGLPAGTISYRMQMAHNTMSFHLGQLKLAGLIQSRKQGRSVIYHADYDQLVALVRFLVEDCCSSSNAENHDFCDTGQLLNTATTNDKPHLKFNWSDNQ